MKALKILTLGLAVAALTSCGGGKSPKEQQDTTQGDYVVKKGAPLSPKDWKFYDVAEQSVCIPVSWTPARQNQYLFFSDLSKISPTAYFIVLKSTSSAKFTAKTGLKQVYEALKHEKGSMISADNVNQIEYADKTVYSGEIKTSSANMSYTNFITIFEKYNEVFEIALKIDDGKAAEYRDIYKNIVFNFYSHQKLVFTANDKVGTITKVDMEGL